MSIPHHMLMTFQAKAREAFGSLASEFNLKFLQKDEVTFHLVGQAIEVRLYLYPSHVPSVNVTLMPRGEQWSKWRQESSWGTTGIWLAHLVAFRKEQAPCPDTHFQTGQELCNHIEVLVHVLRDAGSDLLRGDTTALPQLAAYVDEKVQRKTSEAKLLGVLSSTAHRKGGDVS
jgi:hypothetical protein